MTEPLDDLTRRIERLESHVGLPRPEPIPASPAERLAYLLAAAQATAVTLGMIACWVEVESVIVTAGLVSMLGLWVALNGRKCKSAWSMLLGLSAPWISLLGFVMVNVAEWSPRQAHPPLAVLATFYGITVVLGVAYAWIKHARLFVVDVHQAHDDEPIVSRPNRRESPIPSVAIRCE